MRSGASAEVARLRRRFLRGDEREAREAVVAAMLASCASAGTSPAMRQLSCEASMLVIARTPLRALRSASSAAALPRPKGETMPRPVMTTR